MTEEQKKYYNAMKKLGSKKPQKPIPRPLVGTVGRLTMAHYTSVWKEHTRATTEEEVTGCLVLPGAACRFSPRCSVRAQQP